MEKKLEEAITKLDTVEKQLETAKIEVLKPFAQEAELKEKVMRLAELDAMLNMDSKDMADQEEEHDIRKPFHDKLSEMKEKAGKVTEEDVWAVEGDQMLECR